MNKVILVGRLTKDPELSYMASTGSAVVNFSIAVDRDFTGKDGKRQTDFFNIVSWGKQAENIANYLIKGSLVAIDGEIQNRSYETERNGKRYITEILASRVQFLSKNVSKGNNHGYNEFDDINGFPF